MDFVVKFLLEILSRFTAETPWFFRVVTIIGTIATVITGVPTLLESAGIVLPQAVEALKSDIIAVAGIVAVFVAQLTATTKAKKAKHIED